MSFTIYDKILVCQRYWIQGKSWKNQKNLAGFAELTYNDFQKYIDTDSVFYKRGLKNHSMDWINKYDDGLTIFATMTEREIFEQICRTKGNAFNIDWDKAHEGY